MTERNESIFSGFPYPEENWTKMPNVLIDLLSDLTGAELKCLLYILRHTWGYQEFGQSKRLTVDEFEQGRKRRNGSRMDVGTGLCRSTVQCSLQSLVDKGYIEVDVDDTDKGRIKKSYRVRMQE